ncbi:GTPase Era [Haloimpatiens lingqiaonensis]|uniref:GTPase Era n=1 Tax=Haloimpatiens lingqiaonensis TaxID=1380675 RepID=UPI0010FF093D|nr:GTPase Era [Haloimpatiens lingqiaonensis]
MFKSGFVTIIGRPNVGKSTLTNYLLGEKLSIVSSKPQTTRNNIQTVLTGEDHQLVFVDTPGIHKPKHKLGEYMVDVATESIKNVDLVLFLTTAEVEVGKGDLYILEQLKDIDKPVFLVVNKVDESNPERIAKTLENYGAVCDFKEIIPISAKNGKNVDTLLKLMIENMPEGPMYYPKDMIADVQERFVVTEIIREKALRLLKEEVPHGIAVEVMSMKQTESGKYKIDVNIICEKKSHKGIIIGKQGTMLGKITRYAQEDMKTFLGEKVDLNIWVKVRKEWRDDNNLLKELGYKK